MLYNWPEAARRYSEAETLLAQAGDGKNALAARLGYIWSTVDAGVSPAINKEVATYLDNPLVQSDAKLMLRAYRESSALKIQTNWRPGDPGGKFLNSRRV
jgi:hypothetical protein